MKEADIVRGREVIPALDFWRLPPLLNTVEREPVTMVLRCEKCDKHWLDPYGVASPHVKKTCEGESAIPTIVPLFRRGISRWATPEEVRVKGWDEWVESYISFPTATPKATIRINIANIEPPHQSANLEH